MDYLLDHAIAADQADDRKQGDGLCAARAQVLRPHFRQSVPVLLKQYGKPVPTPRGRATLLYPGPRHVTGPDLSA